MLCQVQHTTVYNDKVTEIVGKIFSANVTDKGLVIFMMDKENNVHTINMDCFDVLIHTVNGKSDMEESDK